jgi:hypothetical protein
MSFVSPDVLLCVSDALCWSEKSCVFDLVMGSCCSCFSKDDDYSPVRYQDTLSSQYLPPVFLIHIFLSMTFQQLTDQEKAERRAKAAAAAESRSKEFSQVII